VSGKAAGAFVGMVALLLSPAASAEVAGTTGFSGGTGGVGGVPTADAPATPVPATPAGPARPALTIFEASPASSVSASSSRALIRFQVRDSARRVRVRLAFVSLAGERTKRVNLGRRRTGVVHSVGRTLKPGSYRVRITAVNPSRRRVVRATTVQVAAPAADPVLASDGVFPVNGPYDFGGSGSRFGAERHGHSHQGQDIAAADGTPVLAPKAGTVHWRAYQASGAGYYLVLDADGEDYMYVFMHLRQGSLLVSKGDRVAAGQQIGQVGNTGVSYGAHLHFEIWDGVWYGGGKPIDPLPILQSWAA
jgi:murein DD-endopeptidase MepM/ murein hydrolase activator NlpD